MAQEGIEVHDGGCLCGRVRYRTRGAPRFMAVCHCRYCQKVTGSAANTEVAFLKEDVQFSGDLRTYEYRSPAHGRLMRSHFCAECGVTVGLSFERFAAVQAILAGTYDDPGWIRFDKHIFTQQALPWMAYSDAMDVYGGHCLGADGAPVKPDRPRSAAAAAAG